MSEAIAASTVETKPNAPQYRVASVEKSKEGPGGAGGNNWHRYILDGVRSPITGYRQGSLKEVTAYAEQCAIDLNARASGKRSPWAPQQKKSA